MLTSLLPLLALSLLVRAQTYSATYLPNSAPKTTEDGQAGTNQCGTGSSQTSMCQNVFINSVDDFCIFAPPNPGPDSVIGNTERIEVSWCIKPGQGTRLIPDGAITGAHFVQTPDYVQVTGVGDLTKINIPDGDEGGELDPHGQDGNGNPIGGLVFSSAFGQLEQLHEWTNFVSFNQFCIRGCKDGSKAPTLCQHIYDTLGCFWNMPGNYDAGIFEKCQGDTGLPMGVYGSSTFHQGDPVTPSAHPAPASSMCTSLSSIGNLAAGSTSQAPTSVSTPHSVTSSSSASPSGPTSVSGSFSSELTTLPSGVASTSGISNTSPSSHVSTSSRSISIPSQSFSSGSPTSTSSSGTTSPNGATSSNGAPSTLPFGMQQSALIAVVASYFAPLFLL